MEIQPGNTTIAKIIMEFAIAFYLAESSFLAERLLFSALLSRISWKRFLNLPLG